MRRVNVAVIGAGYWGKKITSEYLQLAQNNKNVSPPEVCDLRNHNLIHCRDTLGLPSKNLINDYKKVLNSRDIDAVNICTPNETHYQICMDALCSGKHVLIEKPMTLNSKRAYELVKVAKLRGLILQTGYIFRFNNALNEVRRLIEKDYFGDVYYLKLRWTTLMDSPQDRDVISDLAPHPIDILNHLLNRWPLKVFCRAKAYRRKRLEEVAYITVEFDNDILAQIELSWLQPGKTRQVSIIGSKRCATVDCLDQTVRVYSSDGGKVHNLNIERNNTILAEISNFTRCISNGGMYPNDGLVGARNVEVIECIRKSLKEGTAIPVSTSLRKDGWVS